jgi:hypothetical protein
MRGAFSSSRQAPVFRQSFWCGQTVQIFMFSSTERVIAPADAEPESRRVNGYAL